MIKVLVAPATASRLQNNKGFIDTCYLVFPCLIYSFFKIYFNDEYSEQKTPEGPEPLGGRGSGGGEEGGPHSRRGDQAGRCCQSGGGNHH